LIIVDILKVVGVSIAKKDVARVKRANPQIGCRIH
jgi:hypothetical protein